MYIITQQGFIASFKETKPFVTASLPNLSYLAANNQGIDNCSIDPGQGGTPENCYPNILFTKPDCSGSSNNNIYSPYLGGHAVYLSSNLNKVSYEDGKAYLLEKGQTIAVSDFKSTLIDVWGCPKPSVGDMNVATNPWPPVKLEDDACRAFPFTVYQITGESSGSNGSCPSGHCYSCESVTYTQDSVLSGPIMKFNAKAINLPFTLPIALPLHYEVQ